MLSYLISIPLATASARAHPTALQTLAEVSSTPTDIGSLLQYGVLGLVVVGFVTGWIVPGYQAKRLEAEVTRLQGLLEERALPMIERSNITLASVGTALERATEALNARRVEDLIAERNRRPGE